MQSRLRVTVILMAAIAACAPAAPDTQGAPATPAVDLEAARGAIAAANKAWDENYLKGDAAAVAATYSDDAATHPASAATVSGRAAIEASRRADMDSTTYSASSDSTNELIAAGDYVIEIGSWRSAGKTKGGKALNEKGRYMAVWKRDASGAWKIYRDISNNAPAKP